MTEIWVTSRQRIRVIWCQLMEFLTPISYTDNFCKRINEDDILPIELVDTPANIFDRLVFSNTDDTIYKDDDYKNQHRDYYMADIRAVLNGMEVFILK